VSLASGPSGPHTSMSPSVAPASASSQTSASPTNKQNSSPTSNTNGSSQSASRRPPRKSTLTQQQKNQKRQRATQDQLATLELEFNKNPTPTATVRDRIAEEINMTERSVQIWFQNRYETLLAKDRAHNGITDKIAGVPRSSSWPRRASRLARTLTLSQNLCGRTWPCKPWSLARGSEEPTLAGLA
jgi:hypothetical protein